MDNSGGPQSGTQTQSSIRSFFQPKTPNYTPPPATAPKTPATSNGSLPPPPPPSTTRPPPPPLKYTPPPSRTSQSSGTSELDGLSKPSSTPTPHPQATISKIREEHIQPLRRINSLLLPIAYPDNFYHTILSPTTNPNFSRVLLWTDTPSTSIPQPAPKVIGGIVCRLELDPSTQLCQIYIQSLALLSPYRTFGLATALLDEIIKCAIEQRVEPCKIESLYAHVWTENEDALKWYNSRSFVREGSIMEGYYRRLKPDTAVIVRRKMQPTDALRSRSANTADAQLQREAAAAITATNEPRPSRPEFLSGSRAVSYQQKGPAHEWNDLPSEMVVPSRSGTPRMSARPSPNASSTNLLAPPLAGSGGESGGEEGGSRSNSMTREGAGGMVRGKKKRVYPAAAFGAS